MTPDPSPDEIALEDYAPPAGDVSTIELTEEQQELHDEIDRLIADPFAGDV